ncbi:MAG: hypothetical protein GXP54_11640 [Deltaproteobacteria bacterium]|nr:hypothetical protein [Deltaproteobacteria bacterium]
MRIFCRAIWIASVALGCGSGVRVSDVGPGDLEIIQSDVVPFDQTTDSEDIADTLAETEARDAAPEKWVFDRDDYELVNGWILLDSDPGAVKEAIKAAAAYGVNQVQLSHGLIMEIDQILGDSAEAKARVDVLNMGIDLAHQYGMKAFIWCHELSEVGLDVCYDGEDAVWEERADAYREGLARLPGVDGVVMMFGSAPVPPWYTFCSCEWCLDNFETDNPFDAPPRDEKVRIVTEKIGGVITGELGKDLLVRTFVHEPAEIAWHSDGLAAVEKVPFTGMHKGPVQDWEPYNPNNPCTGNVGDHPSVMELDLAGEYYGLSELPFCAPGYYRYRMRYLWEHKGIGVVARVQRGSFHATGTPNEVNIRAIEALLKDPKTPLDSIWNGFIDDRYGLKTDEAGQAGLKRILKDTFYIRLKSHYALGIWALEKGSDLPEKVQRAQFNNRGKMPKWDPDWQAVWDRLDKPDRQTILWLWQEGSEAVDLAAASIKTFEGVADHLGQQDEEDLARRVLHQWYAARAWRAVDLFIWSAIARGQGLDEPDLDSWIGWAANELKPIQTGMTDDGLADVAVASPGRIGQFLANTQGYLVDYSDPPPPPPTPLFSPLEVVAERPDGADLGFSVTSTVHVYLDWGLEIPDYGQVLDAGVVGPGTQKKVTIDGLEPGRRYVARLRADTGGMEMRGGDFWIFTPYSGE